MGCDIHTVTQVCDNGAWVDASPDEELLGARDYNVFGWLAGVRNYSAIEPISEPRGIPLGFEHPLYDKWATCDSTHSPSWLDWNDFGAVDFDQIVEDRRVTRQIAPNAYAGCCTCEPGKGRRTTLRKFLGPHAMRDIERIIESKARIVFWFDN